MARHERDIRAASAASLTADELLSLLGEREEGMTERERQDAIACYLSASDGWPDAVRRLRGAFAMDGSGLRERKTD